MLSLVSEDSLIEKEWYTALSELISICMFSIVFLLLYELS